MFLRGYKNEETRRFNNFPCSMPGIPIGSMYGMFTHTWLLFMVSVGKYTIHESYGIGIPSNGELGILDGYQVYREAELSNEALTLYQEAWKNSKELAMATRNLGVYKVRPY